MDNIAQPMTRDLERLLGEGAQRIIKDQACQAALKRIQDEVLDDFVNSRADDKEGREACYRMVKTVDRFVTILEAYVANAKISEHNDELAARQRKSGSPV